MKKVDYYNIFSLYMKWVKQVIIKGTEMILNRAKDYYENNIEVLTKKQNINVENYLKKRRM